MDHWLLACLACMAVWILLSWLDDLFIALVGLAIRRRAFPWPADAALDAAPERRIAILVPLWHEHRVIGRMLERNLAGVHYKAYDFFVGVYPNDLLTARAVADAAAHDPRVHSAAVPHDGPTSKGDCLNWIYRRMLEYESARGVHFDLVVTHDAEDLIHPESLRLINWFSRDYQMVQVPVLALPTAIRELTHGIYCDEFAVSQSIDIPVRQFLGGFLPGNGVGTGFDRHALDCLAATSGGIFEPGCLTEDYENGYRLHAMGCRQLFVPLRVRPQGPVATREYFPRDFAAAVRQRSRWVAGIALQGWQRHGWRVPWRQVYWFWRDRKGLVGNLLPLAANIAFCFGLLLGGVVLELPTWTRPVWDACLLFFVLHMILRIWACARIFGYRFAAAAPLRMVWGNAVNCFATIAALRQFFGARLRHRVLAWRKTEHVYPTHCALEAGRPRIGDLLVKLRAAPIEEVEEAARCKPEGVRLGEYLLSCDRISEENLYRALSLQAGIPLGAPGEVSRLAARALPIETARRWRVLPYRIDLGQLHVATTEVPSEEMTRELAGCSSLELRFRLVRPADFERLAKEYLTAAAIA